MRLLKREEKQALRTCYWKSIVWLATVFIATSIYANPVLDHIAAGQVSVQQTPNSTVVNQTSQKAILNWQSFNIGQSESTHFQQPAGGIALNRINPSHGPTTVYGRLTATGQIVLINSAGIYFGPTAYVNVGGLIASTGNLSDADFLNGIYRFLPTDLTGSVINQGTLIAANHGLIALVGNAVQNDGYLEARLGTVILGSGSAFTMSFAGNDLISFKVDKPSLKRGTDQHGKPLPNGVRNTGKVNADGGKIMISAKAAQGILDYAVNLDGVAEVRSVSQSQGLLVLGGEPDSGPVRVNAKIYASGKKAGEKGGRVHITADHILVDSSTLIDASGDAGGGEVLIGGNYRGQGPLPTSLAVVMAPGASIQADALTYGNGGQIVLWSDYFTRVSGTLSARGGSLGGDGGLIETSSKGILQTQFISVDTSAPAGQLGNWLLDPLNVTIVNTTTINGTFDNSDPNLFTPTNSNATILNSDINNNLANTNVTITTGDTGSENGDITVSAPITWTSGTTLCLSAVGDININDIISGNGGTLQLIGTNVNYNSTLNGAINLAINASGTVTFNQAIGGSTAISSIDVTGNTVFTGFDNTTTGNQFYRSNMTLTGDTTLTSNSSDIFVFGNIDGGDNHLGINNAGADSELSGIISNLTTLSKLGAGKLRLSGANINYDGITTVSQGSLRVGNEDALGSDSANTFINSGATLAIDSFLSGPISSPLYFNNSNLTEEVSFGSNFITGPIEITGSLNISVLGSFGDTLQITGTISDNGSPITLTKLGNGSLQLLTSANTYSGSTVITEGNISIDNATSFGTSDVSINDGATAFIAAPISLANNFTINSGGTLAVETGSSILDGSLTLNGTATLNINNDATNSLTINGAITGSNVTFNLGGIGKLILAGNGTNTYTGTTNLLSGSIEIQKNSALGSSAAIISNNAELFLNADSLTISNAITFNGDGSSDLGAIADITVGSCLLGSTCNILSGNITLGSDASVIGILNNRRLTVLGNIVGTTQTMGLNKIGTGTLILSGNNTFGDSTHGLTVTEGQVTAQSNTALGASTARTMVSAGAVLALDGNLTIANPITISGTGLNTEGALIISSGSNTLNGIVTLDATGTSIGVTDLSSTLTIGNAIGQSSSDFDFVKVGLGKLIFAGTNTYTGTTSITGGTLELTSASALGSALVHTSSLSVSNGGTLQLSGMTSTATVPLTISGLGVNATGALIGSGTSMWNGNISLGAATTISTLATNDILNLNGTINNNAALTLDGPGTIVFGNTVGNSSPLNSINANSAVIINTNQIITLGSQTYSGDVQISTNTTLSTTNSPVTLSTITSDSTRSLTISSGSGAINLNGNIGTSLAPLGNLIFNSSGTTVFTGTIDATTLTTDAAGSTQINGNATSITTNGNMLFGDALVTLNASPTLNSGSGTIMFSGILGGGTQTLSLQSSAGGNVTFNGSVNLRNLITGAFGYSVSFLGASTTINTSPAAVVTFNNTGGVIFGSGGSTITFTNGVTNTAGLTTLNGNLSSTNAAINLGAMIVAGNSNVSSSDGTMAIGAINSNAAGTNNLTLNSGSGSLTFGTVGGTSRLDNFTATTTGATNDLTIGSNINTSNAISLTAGRSLLLTTGNLNSTSGNINLTATAGAITATTSTLTGSTLTTNSQTGTTLTNANNITTLNATNAASNDVTFANNSNPLTISGISNPNGNITVTQANGITITGTVNAGGNTTTLQAGTSALTMSASTFILGTGTIDLTADNYVLDASAQIGGTALNTGAATSVILKQSSGSLTYGLAGGTGTVNLTAAELDNIFASKVRIGASNAGNMIIGTWTPASTFATSLLTLDTGGTITQTGAITLNSGLLLRNASSVTLSSTNQFSNIAASINGALTLNSSSALTVTSLTDSSIVSGITAPSGVTLTSSGSLTINESINSSGSNGNIALTGAGITQANSTTINAGSGTINLNASGGAMQFNAGTITTTNATSSSLILRNATSVALGNINNTNGTLTLGLSGATITGNISQNTGTTLTTNTLTGLTSGSVDLSKNNSITTLAALTTNGALNIKDIIGLSITGAVNTTNNTITLDSNLAITESGGSLSGSALTATAVNGITLNGANSVTGFAGTVSASGNINLINTATTLTLNGISVASGDVTISNTGNLTTAAASSGTGNTLSFTSTGNLTLGVSAGINYNGAINLRANGSNQLLTLNSNVVSTDNAIVYTADNMDLASLTDAGTSSLTLQTNTAARQIDLGSETAGKLSLTATEYGASRINAALLRIGKSDSGSISITNALSNTSVSTLSLIAGSSISQSSGATLSIADPSNLAISAVGTVTLTEANSIKKVAATVSGSGNGFSLTSTTPLTVSNSAIDGITGVTTNNGPIALNTSGALILDANVISGTSSVTLTSTGSTITQASGSINATTLHVTNTAGNTTLDSISNAIAILGTINTSGRIFTLVDNIATGLTQSGILTADTLVLTNTASNTNLSTSNNAVSKFGNITTTGRDFAFANTIDLSQLDNTSLLANNVTITNTAGSVLLGQGSGQNNTISSIAATLSGNGKSFAYTNNPISAATLTINAVSTNNGNVTITNTSNLTAAQNIAAGSGVVTLSANGSNNVFTLNSGRTISSTGGITYTADNMSLIGSTNFGSATLALQPFSNSTALQLGSGAAASTSGILGLDNAELNTFIGTGTITIGKSTNTGGITVVGVIDAARNFAFLSNGATSINAAIGSTTPVTSLTVTSNGGITLGANITANGSTITLQNATALAANVVLNNSGSVIFNNTLTSPTTARNLTITGGSISFAGNVGTSLNPLGVMALSSTGTATFSGTANATSLTSSNGTTAINGGAITTTTSQNYNHVTLGSANTTLTAGTSIAVNGNTTGVGNNLNMLANAITLTNSISLNNLVITGNGASNQLTLQTNNATQTWNVTNDNAGNVIGITGVTGSLTFATIQSLTGGNNNDSFVFSDDKVVSGIVDGGAGGTNILNFANYTTATNVNLTSSSASGFTGTTSGSINPTGGFTRITNIVGSSTAASTLTSGNTVNTWNITDNNTGSINDSSNILGFTSFRNLVGGSANDSFVFSNGKIISGNIVGNSGTDTINFAAYTTAVTINLQAGTATPIGGTWSGIDNFVGSSSTDIIVGENATRTWNITGTNVGTFNSAITFSSIEVLNGGTGNDTFTFANGASISGNIVGSGGNDAINLAAYSTPVSATVTGNNSGTITGVGGTFSGITNLQGGSGSDTFRINNGGSLSGSITGSGGNDTLSYSTYSSPVSVNLQSNTATGVGGTWTGITSFVGGTGNDTLIAANTVNSWNITSSNGGSVGSNSFSSFENLTGGSGNDAFTLNGGTLSGALNGSGGTNTLTGSNGSTTWSLAGTDAGNVTGVSGGYSNIQNLVGGSGNDTFNVADGARVTGSINGGDGTNTIDYSNYSDGVVVVLASTFTGAAKTESEVAISNYSNINVLIGDYANDRLDLSSKHFDVTFTGNREGFIDDPLYFFGFTTSDTPEPPPPPPPPPPISPPNTGGSPSLTTNIADIFQQPEVNATTLLSAAPISLPDWLIICDPNKGRVAALLNRFSEDYEGTLSTGKVQGGGCFVSN